jgi:hypothetical protein
MGAQLTQLVLSAGMATPAGGLGSTALSTPRNYPSALISVAGGLANGMNYSLDGANHNDPYGSVNLPLPFPDAMQEFKVETNALPAQYGFHSAAAVNAITKSGTNIVHGDGFEFLRDHRLNAKNAFAAIGPDGKRRDDGLAAISSAARSAGRSSPTSCSTSLDVRARALTSHPAHSSPSYQRRRC